MVIRNYAKSIGFEIVGVLRYMGKWDRNTRWFMDEDQNVFLIDDILKTIRIKPKKEKSVELTTDLI